MSETRKTDLLSARIEALRDALPAAVLRVARYIDQNRVAALASSATELARAIGTSDATVVRAAKALGFSGLPDLRKIIAESLDSGSTPAANMKRTLARIDAGTEHAIDFVLETHQDAIAALKTEATRLMLIAAVSTLNSAQRIVVFGIGQSGPLARYMSILLGRSGRRSATCDASGIALADQLLDLQAGDALLLLAYGGAYQEVEATIEEGQRLGLPIVLVTDSLEQRLAERATIVVPVRRGKARKVALHAATVAALEAIALGLSAVDQKRSVDTLSRLGALRETISRPRKTGRGSRPSRR
ncbi:MurR/RpiR family transcriptional regulator [Sphingomonas sp. H39-1-10]|uniref:MurR/RpiR family transcriptional regulator n=1 Tax=Sphingomonas pollutisoli TaxID=3030829 RepID=UPI0023B99FCD|nr:MurR/RpiR family transcriptional regulator [Sphingomonas pollutisoli]MDF0491375.1 MurR/RpiR family transcriptional regulator [Sphingomonas pollutisoli]